MPKPTVDTKIVKFSNTMFDIFTDHPTAAEELEKIKGIQRVVRADDQFPITVFIDPRYDADEVAEAIIEALKPRELPKGNDVEAR